MTYPCTTVRVFAKSLTTRTKRKTPRRVTLCLDDDRPRSRVVRVGRSIEKTERVSYCGPIGRA